MILQNSHLIPTHSAEPTERSADAGFTPVLDLARLPRKTPAFQAGESCCVDWGASFLDECSGGRSTERAKSKRESRVMRRGRAGAWNLTWCCMTGDAMRVVGGMMLGYRGRAREGDLKIEEMQAIGTVVFRSLLVRCSALSVLVHPSWLVSCWCYMSLEVASQLHIHRLRRRRDAQILLPSTRKMDMLSLE